MYLQKKQAGVKVWLVTWESLGDHVKLPREHGIAAILDPRLSFSNVRKLVDFLYATQCYDLSDQLRYVFRKSKNPYPARWENVNGRQTIVTCGDNPFLLARLVDDLRVQRDEQGKEFATWKDKGSRETDLHRTSKKVGD